MSWVEKLATKLKNMTIDENNFRTTLSLTQNFGVLYVVNI